MVPACSLLLLCVVGYVYASPLGGVVTTETYKQSLVLDKEGNYLLFWNYNDKNVTFEVHVKTFGYVGFGISPNGKMYPSDVVVGWVKNGVAHFQDRHTVGHSVPLVDKSQDWSLLQAFENDFGTVLKFVRDIDTCDPNEDSVIQEGTVRLIYSYHPDDPVSDDALVYHGEHRGTASVSLLSESVLPTTFPADVKYYEFLNGNFMLPAVKTYYHCTGFQMPNIGGKHHMIEYEALVTPGNEMLVHHILLYRCRLDPKYDGASVPCYDHRPLDRLPYCWDVVVAWAIGGKPFYFPDHVGLSVGAPDDATFYIMETHYDNPNQLAGVIDNSGLRIALTQTLRPNELGLFEIGQDVDWQQIVPPKKSKFISKSYCHEDCINRAMNSSNLSEVKAIAAFQHAHLLGVGIKTRHFRNGVELPPLINDPNYDFDFQETRMLQKELPLRPGDSFMVECTYDSSKKDGPVFGGLATSNEMCVTFIYYYPKSKVYNCLSTPELFLGLGLKDEGTAYHYVAAIDWNNSTEVADFLSKADGAPIRHRCGGAELTPEFTFDTFAENDPAHPYVAPPKTCTGN